MARDFQPLATFALPPVDAAHFYLLPSIPAFLQPTFTVPNLWTVFYLCKIHFHLQYQLYSCFIQQDPQAVQDYTKGCQWIPIWCYSAEFVVSSNSTELYAWGQLRVRSATSVYHGHQGGRAPGNFIIYKFVSCVEWVILLAGNIVCIIEDNGLHLPFDRKAIEASPSPTYFGQDQTFNCMHAIHGTAEGLRHMTIQKQTTVCTSPYVQETLAHYRKWKLLFLQWWKIRLQDVLSFTNVYDQQFVHIRKSRC